MHYVLLCLSVTDQIWTLTHLICLFFAVNGLLKGKGKTTFSIWFWVWEHWRTITLKSANWIPKLFSFTNNWHHHILIEFWEVKQKRFYKCHCGKKQIEPFCIYPSRCTRVAVLPHWNPNKSNQCCNISSEGEFIIFLPRVQCSYLTHTVTKSCKMLVYRLIVWFKV